MGLKMPVVHVQARMELQGWVKAFWGAELLLQRLVTSHPRVPRWGLSTSGTWELYSVQLCCAGLRGACLHWKGGSCAAHRAFPLPKAHTKI